MTLKDPRTTLVADLAVDAIAIDDLLDTYRSAARDAGRHRDRPRRGLNGLDRP